jgi:hypothetical protein
MKGPPAVFPGGPCRKLTPGHIGGAAHPILVSAKVIDAARHQRHDQGNSAGQTPASPICNRISGAIRPSADRQVVRRLQREPPSLWARNDLPQGVHSGSSHVAGCPVKRGQHQSAIAQPRQSLLGISELKPGRVEEVALILDPRQGQLATRAPAGSPSHCRGINSSVSVTSSLILRRKGGTARAQRELD